MTWALKASYGDLSWCATAYLRNETKIKRNPAAAYRLILKGPRQPFQEVDHPTKNDPLVEREAFWMGFIEGLMRVWERLEQSEEQV